MSAGPSSATEDLSVREPPRTGFGILKKLGPGLIIAASIVGSGELIATTRTGAEAGFSLLWLILIGCVIKVFAQVEIGRYAIISGQPTLSALNEVPGPKILGRGNWLVWYWFFMWFASVGQLGAIVGSVGQAMALSLPVTSQGKAYNEIEDLRTLLQIQSAVAKQNATGEASERLLHAQVNQQKLEQAEAEYKANYPSNDPTVVLSIPKDDRIWAIPFALVTSVLLIWGRFGVVLTVATALVVAFTAITVGNVAALQSLPDWRITGQDILDGLSFQLPPSTAKSSGLAIGLATIGIIGVGAAELVQYPYWVLEKGYAKWTGKYDGSDRWLERARGWMRVMQVDAWVSMVIYTVATIAFYLLGAAILHRCGLAPSGNNLIRTLATMYQPVFSSAAPILFLIGAFAVLYSTFYVANASHARTFADGMSVVGLIDHSPHQRDRWVTILCGLFPILCLLVYLWLPEPAMLVNFSGMVQAIMLPMLCGAALYFRYVKNIDGLPHPPGWDIGLWASSILMLGIAIWTFWTNLLSMLNQFTG